MTEAAILIADLCCDECGSKDIVAISPGTDAERSDLFLLQREEPVRCLCIACWVAGRAREEA